MTRVLGNQQEGVELEVGVQNPRPLNLLERGASRLHQVATLANQSGDLRAVLQGSELTINSSGWHPLLPRASFS